MTLFFTEMWERFSYYGMRALLILFMTKAIVDGGLGFDDKTAGAVYGLYTMGVYLLALPGGWLADRLFGLKKSVWYGGIIIALGHFMMALPGIQTWITGVSAAKESLSTLDTTSFFLGLILIVLGTGLLKPNISSIVGQLYPAGSSKRDAGFSIFYMGINIGGFIAPIACSTVAEYDMHLGFGLAGLGMVFGLIQYKLTGGALDGYGEAPVVVTEVEKSSQKQLRSITSLIGLIGAVFIAVLFTGVIPINASAIAGASGSVIAVVAFGYLGYVIAFGGLEKADKNKVGVIAILFLFSAMFWSGFEQAGSSMTIYTDKYINRELFGWTIPTTYFQSVNPLFIVLLGPVFAWFWTSKFGRRLTTPVKMSLGMILLGIGFLFMYVATFSVDVVGAGDQEQILKKAALSWLVLTYFFHTIGELCLSPVGLSVVTKLAPVKLASMLMGVWMLSSFVANIIGGFIAAYVEKLGAGTIFVSIALFVIGLGVLMLLLSRKLSKMMHGVK